MSQVSVHHEWDPLQEAVVGTVLGGRTPPARPDVRAPAHAGNIRPAHPRQLGPHPWPDRALRETEDQLDELCEELRGLDVTVRRCRDRTSRVRTPGDRSHAHRPWAGRVAVGRRLVEAPAAGHVVRLGADLLYLDCGGGAPAAGRLAAAAGDTYTVHHCRGLAGDPDSTRLDPVLIPLRPGLVLVNPSRVTDDNLPPPLRSWRRIDCPEPVALGYAGDVPRCSVWIGMSVLVVRPGLVIAEARQRELLRVLEQHGIDVLPLRLTHARMLRGGFHDVVLDLRRTGPRTCGI
ncbi:hypothetical protein GCM10010269_16150 [Streptomyces humidus]|uniref:Uncharacterized protein n=1 Tax=Streptomyces humidus TaxID=52259 RepID=A0A918FTC3_9ACTN|nr:inosamine-phosphate amidinotransferase 1 [Streptomyces humidus]GGR77650.1 hypothetical protein GCM10010269_16150 [Streptomyces humidus]